MGTSLDESSPHPPAHSLPQEGRASFPSLGEGSRPCSESPWGPGWLTLPSQRGYLARDRSEEESLTHWGRKENTL